MSEVKQTIDEIKKLYTVLVTEDDLGLQRLIRKRLARDGYKTAQAASGQEAIDHLEKEKTALLLLDFRLGDMTGKEVIAKLAGKGQTVPFIIMTGHGDERTAVEMMKLGARDYLVKDEGFLEILPQVLEKVINQLSMEEKLTQARKALRESEKRFRLIFNSGTDAIFLYDAPEGKPGHFLEVNEMAFKRLGYTREELLEMTPGDIEDPKHETEPSAQAGETVEKKNQLYETAHITKGGKKIPVEINSHLIDFGGEPAFLSISRDITERKQLEEQLRHAQKMEAIGKLAGGVAHDFNNLLTTINGYAELLLLKLGTESPFRDGVKKIKRAGEKAASLTQQLLTFSSKQVLQSRRLDMNGLLLGIEKTLKQILGDDVNLVLEPGADLMAVKADHDQVEQIIINLSVNSCDAMPDGGTLTIKTENKVIDEYYSSLLHDAKPGHFVCLSICDSGSGMDDKTLQYIFEPFYSTKKVGTGLGLSVVYGIVKQHEGWINVYSKPGRGTIFRVYFQTIPGKTAVEDNAVKQVSLDKLRGNDERILLVDDEDGVRKKTAEYLKDYGYRVTEAVNLKEAKDTFKNEKGEFQLCFSSNELPDSTGAELAETIQALEPGFRVLLCTSYGYQHSSCSDIKVKGYPLLEKPYSLMELLTAIKEILK
ncbi:MAG: response regulator [Candidatus Aminicenantes bacterium]|nr:response regulator [Candidatus Aminicenantes bacterium]